MELVFVQQYGDGTSKRRRLAKACDSCRARKKRCIHVANAPSTEPESDVQQDRGCDEPERALRPILRRRFVSDLKPESTFLSRHSSDKNSNNVQNEDIGVWVDKREWDALVRQKAQNASSELRPPLVHDSDRPHSASLGPLIDIYFKKINPILPILDEAEFRKRYTDGLVPEQLAHAICLVAAKDAEAEPYLRSTDSIATLTPRKFCSNIYASVMSATRTPVRFERITLIRILALASLHAEGPDGAEEASMCLTQALHYTQTPGWHLGQHTGISSGADLTTKRLFWCLWSLDRMNSCIHGRPIMMSDIDIGIERFAPGESGFPAFDVWMCLSRLLDKTISFYRPGNPAEVTGWEDEYPSFEDAVDEGRGWSLPQTTLATLHVFYLMLAVLSHRSRGVKFVPRATPSYVRQSLCALELNRLMSSPLLSSIHPLPVLPYAISLALSVAYRHLRQSHLQHQQEDARNDFRLSCDIIQKMRQTWSSVDAIAAISKTVLERLDRTTDLSTLRGSRDGHVGTPTVCTASMDKPGTLLLDERSESTSFEGEGANIHGPRTPSRDSATGVEVPLVPPAAQEVQEFLFAGMDDICGTYLDPNNPLHLDDFAFLDDTSTFDWGTMRP